MQRFKVEERALGTQPIAAYSGDRREQQLAPTMPPSKASAVFASRLSDDDPSQRHLDLYIALSVLEKLEVSYSKSLLSVDEYERELAAGIKQAQKAHRLVASEFPTFGEFARDLGSRENDAGGHAGTHEFQRAIMQLEGGQDLIGMPMGREQVGPQTDARPKTTYDQTDKTIGVSGSDDRAMMNKVSAIWEAAQEIRESLEAYHDEKNFSIKVGFIQDQVKIFMEQMDLMNERDMKVGGIREHAEKLRGWQARLEGMQIADLIDSRALSIDLERFLDAMRGS